MLKNKNGITVAELKKFVMSLPEVDDDGENEWNYTTPIC